TGKDDVEIVRWVALAVQVLTSGHRPSVADWRQRREFSVVQLEEGFRVGGHGYPLVSLWVLSGFIRGVLDPRLSRLHRGSASPSHRAHAQRRSPLPIRMQPSGTRASRT